VFMSARSHTPAPKESPDRWSCHSRPVSANQAPVKRCCVSASRGRGCVGTTSDRFVTPSLQSRPAPEPCCRPPYATVVGNPARVPRRHYSGKGRRSAGTGRVVELADRDDR
jgi:hypothetical protein